MIFRFCGFVVAAASLAASLHSSAVFAATEEENTRLIFFGMGIGWGSLMCDLLENEILDQTRANIVVSNMRAEMKTDSSYTEPPLGPIRSQSATDGFNAAAKEFSGCSLKF